MVQTQQPVLKAPNMHHLGCGLARIGRGPASANRSYRTSSASRAQPNGQPEPARANPLPGWQGKALPAR